MVRRDASYVVGAVSIIFTVTPMLAFLFGPKMYLSYVLFIDSERGRLLMETMGRLTMTVKRTPKVADRVSTDSNTIERQTMQSNHVTQPPAATTLNRPKNMLPSAELGLFSDVVREIVTSREFKMITSSPLHDQIKMLIKELGDLEEIIQDQI